LFKDLAEDDKAYREYQSFYQKWKDQEAYEQSTVHNLAITTRETCECAQCGYRTSVTNRVCPFCMRHITELAGGSVLEEKSMNGSTRIIQRLAKSMITDRSHPGFSFPYRGVHSPTWHQTQILLKHDRAWREERTRKYNSVNPGEAFTSLMDRIRKDQVYRHNLIVQGDGQRKRIISSLD